MLASTPIKEQPVELIETMHGRAPPDTSCLAWLGPMPRAAEEERFWLQTGWLPSVSWGQGGGVPARLPPSD